MNDLKDFARNRMNGLESAVSKLNKNIETIYNDNYVNFYLNLENNSKNSKFYLIQREFPKVWSKKYLRSKWMEEKWN